MKKIYYSFLFLLLIPLNAFAFGNEVETGISGLGKPETHINMLFIINWVFTIGTALGIAGIIFGLGLYIAQALSKDKNKKIFKNKKRILLWSIPFCVISLLIIFFLIVINSHSPHTSESF